MADSGHYPAIDIEKSISRVMPKVTSREHLLAARRIKQLISAHTRSRDMVAMGAYMPGNDPELDLAMRLWPQIQTLLRQESDQVSGLSETIQALLALTGGGP